MQKAHGRRTARVRVFNKKGTGNTYNINNVGVMNFGDNCAVNHFYDKNGKWVRMEVEVGSREAAPPSEGWTVWTKKRKSGAAKRTRDKARKCPSAESRNLPPVLARVTAPASEDTPPIKEKHPDQEEIMKSEVAEQAPADVSRRPLSESRKQPPADSQEFEPTKEENESTSEATPPASEDTPPIKEELPDREGVLKSEVAEQAPAESKEPEPPGDEQARAEAELRLARYVRDGDRRAKLIKTLSYVMTAHDFAFMAVASLCDLPNVTRDIVVKRKFFMTLLPFAPLFTEGRTESNIRVQINKMLERNKADWNPPPRIR